jgi:hypothetical protein
MREMFFFAAGARRQGLNGFNGFNAQSKGDPS